MVSNKEFIIKDIGNIIKNYLLCKNNDCNKIGKTKLEEDIWSRDGYRGYYCTTCEKKINWERQWVGGSGPGRAFFQGC